MAEEVTLNSYMDGFKFNLLGILNTTRDNSIYTVTAKLNHLQFRMTQVDWDFTTQNRFRFAQADFRVDKKDYSLEQHANIVYTIDKYNPSTKKIKHNYAFAVQPISAFTTFGQLSLVVGQYQLPIYEGQPPNDLYRNLADSKEIIKRQQKQGLNLNIEFAQLVVRLSQKDSQEAFAQEWWPYTETKMTFVHGLRQPHKLHKYVLHARHRYVVEDKDMLL